MMVEVLKTANENTQQLLDEKLPEQRSEKRSKLEKVTLYSKSNQQQMNFQQQVLDIFEKSDTMIERNKLKEAQNLIEKGKRLCYDRIKLIRIADRDGWATAMAYQSDDLASDSEDEKRIQKANRIAASRKRMRQKEYPSTSNSSNNTKNNPSPAEGPKQSQRRYKMEDVICWKCGQKGHFFSSCTNPPRETETQKNRKTNRKFFFFNLFNIC